jgi:hypothetical protein
MSNAHSKRRIAVVYFIQAGDDGPIKVGRTTGDPAERMRSLQTASPYRLRLLATKVASRNLDELLVHGRFVHLRLHGEWFSPGADLLEFIADEHAICDGLVRPSVVPAPSSRPGRRWCGSDEAERMKHIRSTALLMSGHYSAEGLAALHGVTVRTVYRWRDLALGYDDPEAEGLKRLAGKVTS